MNINYCYLNNELPSPLCSMIAFSLDLRILVSNLASIDENSSPLNIPGILINFL